jgi:hypothetical protein
MSGVEPDQALTKIILTDSNSNDPIRMMVDSLKYISGDSLNCNADLYWRIVTLGEKAIPYLIENITDSTLTHIKYDCKKGPLTAGEISYFAIDKIAPIYAFRDIGIQFCTSKNGCWSFYDYLFQNENKLYLENRLAIWYLKNKSTFKYISKADSTLSQCEKKYKISGYYEIK